MATQAGVRIQSPQGRSDSEIEAKLKEWNISREEFDRLQALKLEREGRIAPVGAMAPNFELELLSAKGEGGKKTVRLSSLRGQPVALAFGSYT